jgi:hypothetical protein
VFHVQALAEEVVNLTDSCAPGEGGLKVGCPSKLVAIFRNNRNWNRNLFLFETTETGTENSFDSKQPKLEPKLVSIRNNQN